MDRPQSRCRPGAILLLALTLMIAPPLPSQAGVAGSPAASRAGAAPAPEPPSPEQIQKLIKDGRWPEAEAESRRLLSVAESAAGGADSLDAARALDLLVEVYWRSRKARDPQARVLAERAVSIKEARLGNDHRDLAVSVKNLGNICMLSGDLDAAERHFRRAISITEASLGPEHPDVARILNNLSTVLSNRGDFPGALDLAKRSLSIMEAGVSSDDPALITFLNNLGNLESVMGREFEARPYLERALDLARKRLPPGHPDLAPPLNNLASTIQHLGDYEGALRLFEESLSIRRKAYGDESESVAGSYYNMSESYRQMDDFPAARACLDRALELYTKVLGPENEKVAAALANIATLLGEMGDHASSLPLRERAQAILEKKLGPEHPTVAQGLHGLGNTLAKLGKPAEADESYKRAIAIYEKSVGPEHPYIAATLRLRGSLKERAGDPAGARQLYEQALEMLAKAYTRNHPLVADTLENLGNLALDQGDYPAARKHFEEIQQTLEPILGPDHPSLLESLDGLARLDLLAGEYSRSLDGSLRAQRILREHFRRTARHLSEREALTYEAYGGSALGMALSALASMPASPAAGPAIERVWEEIMKSRAMVLDEMAIRHSPVRDEGPEVAALRQSVTQARRRLAHLALQGPDPDHPEAYRDRLSEARAESERQERSLAAKSSDYRRELQADAVSLVQLRASLPRDAALVAYSRYPQEPSALSVDGRTGPPPASFHTYGAFVLRPADATPQFVPLPLGAEVERLVKEWRSGVSSPSAGLAGVPDSAEARSREAGVRLRKAVWDPLADRLKGARTVLLVPDGELSLVNFSALPRGRAGYLIESGPILHYLSAERDLAAGGETRAGRNEIFLLGGPDFEANILKPAPPGDSAPAATVATTAPPPPGAPTYRSPAGSCPELSGLRFEPLPMAVAEVGDLSTFFLGGKAGTSKPGALVELTGPSASESAFKARAPGHRILHLATHGFFMTETCSARSSPGPADSPLILSGLALAGANHRAETSSCTDCEDGMLTAAEIASLDLHDAEWVVLSACETGVGKVTVGEGILGLRRAFQIAGARTLILSLWKVEDAATRDFMRRLYESRRNGTSTAEAMRNAGRDTLKARRAAGKSTSPFYWGAFVAAGDWR